MKFSLLFLFFLLLNCHLPSSSVSNSKQLNGDFRERLAKGQDVYVEKKDINEPLDFTALVSGYAIAPGTKRVEIGGAVTFYKCQFKGKVSGYSVNQDGSETTAVKFAKNLTFIECTFEDEVNFRACSVGDLACFSNCYFLKKAVFEEADFNDFGLFTKNQFKGETRFQNAFFRKKGDFLRTEFFDRVNFQGSVFALDAQFGSVKFYKTADFATAQFNGHAFFNYSEWLDSAVLSDAWFKGRSEFLQAKFNQASFKNSRFYSTPLFAQAGVQGALDMTDCKYLEGKPDWEGVDKGKVKGG